MKILGTWMFVTVWPPCATWPPRDGAGAADLPKPPNADAPTASARTIFILFDLRWRCVRMRVASYVARDNVRHQAPKAPLTLAWWGQLRQRAVRPLPVQIRVERARRSMLQIMVGNQRVRTLYVSVFASSSVWFGLAPAS